MYIGAVLFLIRAYQYLNTPTVQTSVVGFVEACQFHNGQLDIQKDKAICYYPENMPTLHKVIK